VDALSIVVIPARDEADHLPRCLAALAAQTVGRDQFELIVVADACRDDTVAVAEHAARELGLTLRVLTGPGRGAGAARLIGMDAAAALLEAGGRVDGLIACTDADSRPRPDWLERQLAHIRDGAEAIAGLIELEPPDAQELPAGVRERRSVDAAERLRAVHEHDQAAEHHHSGGASLGITARAYRRVGGIEPLAALEDAAFAQRLAEHGVHLRRASDVRVLTSGRLGGRAARGLAVDLAVSTWLERRRYTAEAFPLDGLAAGRRTATITVIIPTRECAETIGGVLERTVGPARDAGLVQDVVVIDAGSRDGTAERAASGGARVLQQDALLAEHGPAQGKGDAMWRALSATGGDIVCFLDGDTLDPDPRHLHGLIGPLLLDPDLVMVKAAFRRPFRSGEVELADEGGRVTELMARPLLNLHHPRLAGFAQPLAGEFAARRTLLESLPFPVGYGVEIATLIDALDRCGLDALAETAVGERRNRHQPLRALGTMAYAVLVAVERRLEPRSPVGGRLLQPWRDGLSAPVPVEERPPLVALQRGAAAAAG
jgi:glucosyl-3-phosphoglycerate synthase